jgi:hypothetical protein
VFLHLKNRRTNPMINSNPATPPIVPPIIAFLFTFFDPPLLLVGAAVALGCEEEVFAVIPAEVDEDAVEVEAAMVCTVGVKARPTPVSAARVSYVEM